MRPRIRCALQFGLRACAHLCRFPLFAFRIAACLHFSLRFLFGAIAQFGFVLEHACFIRPRFFSGGQFPFNAQLVLRRVACAGFMRDPRLGFRRGGLFGLDSGFRFHSRGGFGLDARQRQQFQAGIDVGS